MRARCSWVQYGYDLWPAIEVAIAASGDARAISAQVGYSSVVISCDHYGRVMLGTSDSLAAELDPRSAGQSRPVYYSGRVRERGKL
jgi:hypothetical protein